MSIKVRIPAPLRTLTGGEGLVEVSSESIGDAIAKLEAAFPGIKERLCEETGEIRRFVNIYVNGEDVRFLDGLGTTLSAGDEISIVPAVAGG